VRRNRLKTLQARHHGAQNLTTMSSSVGTTAATFSNSSEPERETTVPADADAATSAREGVTTNRLKLFPCIGVHATADARHKTVNNRYIVLWKRCPRFLGVGIYEDTSLQTTRKNNSPTSSTRYFSAQPTGGKPTMRRWLDIVAWVLQICRTS